MEGRTAPVAVIIDDHPKARPQSGLNEACLVFAAPVEGGIARFLAVYGHGQTVGRIGPVRSMRPYFVELAQALGLVLAHCGGSPEAYELAEGLGLARIDDIKGGWRAFRRDASRRAPHNLYTDTGRLGAEIRRRGLASGIEIPVPEGFGSFEGADPAPTVAVPSLGLSFLYREENGLYSLASQGTLRRDERGNPIRAAAVVVVEVPATVVDRVGRLRLDLEARPCLVAAEGRARTALWPGVAGDPGRPVEEDGRPIRLPAGPIWIVLAPLRSGAEK